MLEDILSLPPGAIVIADIGAAFYGEAPPYQPLLDRGLGRLFAFDPDPRQHDILKKRLSENATIYPFAIGDGSKQTLHICTNGFGMSSLLKPDETALGFFNLFPQWAQVLERTEIDTRRLDDIDDLPPIDFLKMDIQGSELAVLRNGRDKLAHCVFIQSEVSFVPLYENQPGFGEIDIEMRAQGLIPHRFLGIKLWPISPAVRDNNPQLPFSQLLEADLVYMRNVIRPAAMSNLQIAKLAVIAHYCYGSPDLAMRCILELQSRSALAAGALDLYLKLVK